MTIHVVYEDSHLLVVEKPSMLVTQNSLDHDDSLEERAKDYLKKKYHKPGAVFLHAVHRLDKEVSGLVLFARTSKALSRLQEMMRKQEISKFYVAWVQGHLKNKQATLVHFLAKGDHQTKVVSSGHPEGKESTLVYEVIKESKQNSCVQIQLITGRYHQIRAQMSAIGHPVLGDTKYGSSQQYPNGRIDLKHQKMIFTHPVTKETLCITSTCDFS